MKRIFAILIASVMLTAVLAGCNNATSPPVSTPPLAATPAPGTTTPTENLPEPDAELSAHLRVLYPGTSDIERQISIDMELMMNLLYPGVTVEFMYLSWGDIETRTAVMVQAGNAPDVTQTQAIANFVAMEAFEPIEQYLGEGSSLSRDMFSPVGLEFNTIDGVLYALPMTLITNAHIVNTNLFEVAGVDPFAMSSWGDVEAAVQAITAATGNGVFGYAMANGGEGRFCFRDVMMIAASNGFSPDDTSEATKPKYIELLNYIKNISGSISSSHSTWLYPELFMAWEAQQSGMMHTGSFFTANVVSHGTDAMEFTRVVPMPAGPSHNSPVVNVSTGGYAMFAGSNQKEAAWKFIELAFSESIVGKLCASFHAPAVNYVSQETLVRYAEIVFGSEVAAKHIELMAAFQDAANKYGQPMPAIVGQPAMEIVVQDAIVRLIDGRITVEDAYDLIKTGIDNVKASLT